MFFSPQNEEAVTSGAWRHQGEKARQRIAVSLTSSAGQAVCPCSSHWVQVWSVHTLKITEQRERTEHIHTLLGPGRRRVPDKEACCAFLTWRPSQTPPCVGLNHKSLVVRVRPPVKGAKKARIPKEHCPSWPLLNAYQFLRICPQMPGLLYHYFAN